MKNYIRLLVAISMITIVLTSPLGFSSRADAATIKWSYNNGWYYYNNGIIMKSSWVLWNNSWYYLGSDGKMVTGWIYWKNGWYYLNADGKMATGWINWNNSWYYLNANGKMATGWINWNNGRYYLNADGKMATGWIYWNNGWYYLNASGKMITGWLDWNNGRYYLNADGKMAIGWIYSNNSWYYLNANGKMITGWLDWNNGKYYLNADGKMVTGWLDWNNDRYYLNVDGKMVIGWLDWNNSRYYFGPDGKMQTTSDSQGVVRINSYDESKRLPIKNTSYNIYNQETGQFLERVATDVYGNTYTSLYNYGTTLKIVEAGVSSPYVVDSKAYTVTINNNSGYINLPSHMPAYITGYLLNQGVPTIVSVNNAINPLLQNPELPNGCEITSLTAVLNSLGYRVSKTTMSDNYLPKIDFYRYGGKLYGADPNIAFAGNPRANSGFYVFAPPIVKAANSYLSSVGAKYHAVDLTGSSESNIIAQLNQGRPVVIWATLDMSSPHIGYSWYLTTNGSYYGAYTNLHSMVITGYDANHVYVMNPLRGNVTYDRWTVFNAYNQMGKRAVVLANN